MTKSFKKSVLPAAAFALAALIQTIPATASARDQVVTQRVQYGDLDLTHPDGLKTLDRRLDRAVSRVCGDIGFHDLQSQASVSKCKEDARNNIQPQRQIAIAKATERRNGVGLAQRSSFELPVVASAR